MIDKRVLESADVFMKNDLTMKELGEMFGVSESTANYDLRHRLKLLNSKLHKEVGEKIDRNIIASRVKRGQDIQNRLNKVEDHSERIKELEEKLEEELTTNRVHHVDLINHANKSKVKAICISSVIALTTSLFLKRRA